MPVLGKRRRQVPGLAVLSVVAVVVALVVGPSAFALLHNDRGPASATPAAGAKSYDALVAANYRVLSPAQTRRLLRFADALYSCMSTHGSRVGKPKALDTKLQMRLPATEPAERTLRLMGSCGDRLGGPPKDASLILRGHAVELYLPKQCLLDRKVVASGRA